MEPKYNLETSYVAIFLSTEGWICGPKDPMAVQGLLRFTGGSWTKQGTKDQIYGPNTKLFFSLSKERSKRRFWKGALHSTGAPFGKTGGGLHYQGLRETGKKKRLWKLNVSFYRSSAMGTWREGPFIWDSEDTQCVY